MGFMERLRSSYLKTGAVSNLQLKLRLSFQPDNANAPLKAKDEYLYYPLSLSFLGAGKNSVVNGEPSVRASRTPLQWVDVKPEHLHV